MIFKILFLLLAVSWKAGGLLFISKCVRPEHQGKAWGIYVAGLISLAGAATIIFPE